ncbi:spore Coat Protein U domain protein [Yersinia ruckeri]|uniref:Csu type fimbrial protein n=1 Tax=Yersinia ruckeri TaxID=29486 RepID=UPI0005ACAD8C|nr:spore coat protein U domain-containing protein [Yersinia ruckeri]AJI94621.1 spore Coat Protein U domain protein [Yersinia ruckeri]MCW6567157.1 spore coat U domain-containing protein [Yersinia ruckeri]
MKRMIGLAVLFIALLVGVTHCVQAACTTAEVNGTFGSVTSFALKTTPASSTSGSVSVNCTVSVLGLLTNDTISLQLVSSTYFNGSTPVLQTSAASTDSIPISVCTTNTNPCTAPMLIGGAAINFNSSSLINLSTSNKNFTLPIYLLTLPSSSLNVAAGTYTTTLGIKTTYAICTILTCALGGQTTGSPILPLIVTIVVSNDCTTITADSVSFGSQPLLSSFSSVSNRNIAVVCTKGSTYTVSLDNGQHSVGGVRYMARNGTGTGTGNIIAYDIYQGANNTFPRWGSLAAGQAWSSNDPTSTNSDLVTKNYTYSAQILSGQTTPTAGAFTDTITVSLSF